VWVFDEPRLRSNFAVNDAIFRKVILEAEGQQRLLELTLDFFSAIAEALNVYSELHNLVKVRVVAHHEWWAEEFAREGSFKVQNTLVNIQHVWYLRDDSLFALCIWNSVLCD